MAYTCRGVQAWHGPLVSSWLANRGRWHSTLVVETRMLCVRAEHGLDNRRRWGRHWSGLRKSCHPVPLVVWWCILLAVWCIPLVYQQVYSTWVPSATGFCCFSTLSDAHTHTHPGSLSASGKFHIGFNQPQSLFKLPIGSGKSRSCSKPDKNIFSLLKRPLLWRQVDSTGLGITLETSILALLLPN